MSGTPGAPRPPLRTALDAIPAYRPGRPPVPVEGRPTYKLSSNENPYPPLPGVVAAATDALTRVNRYPDMGAQRFYDTLAARLGVEVAHLAGGTGSVAVLYHLLQAFCERDDEVVLAWRSFEAYPIGIGLVGARPVMVPLDAEARHDLPAMLAAITDRTRVVLVCTPNNPTGPAVGHAELEAFLDAVPSDVLVVVDEAYVEFVRDPDAADGMALGRGRENVVVLRTFSKAYGLAGLRVGYAVATPRVAEAIRKVAVPFGVSDLAQAAAVASMDAEDELLARVQAIVDERERVVAALHAQGWRLPDAQTNFVWLPLGERALDFAAACSDAGIMVRPFAGEGVRVTIAEPEADDVLLEVARAWVPSGATPAGVG